ncbi:MAG: aspartate/glutamate racemase family protein [Tissierellales bacterium]|nr:aspartate/glutamate racemase family protein [Tissierellales bacterium]MBN2827368.1 aspartate/glutamate racemase family protein [Tissierellales bacterium]
MSGNKIIRNYGYIGGKGDDNKRFHITKNQWVSGYTIGIMLLDVHYPLLPGNVVNAYTYDFPVRHMWVPGANQDRMHSGDDTLLPALIESAKQLEIEGCRAICGACGYFGHFQERVAEAMDIPVYLSSLVQVPWIKTGLKKSQKIGILCADGHNLTNELFAACGVNDTSMIVSKSAGHLPEFSALMERRGHFDNEILRQELIDLAKEMVEENPDIGAILLECSDMPPYAAAIQAELNLPIFDFITMIKFVHSSVAQKPYYGFM